MSFCFCLLGVLIAQGFFCRGKENDENYRYVDIVTTVFSVLTRHLRKMALIQLTSTEDAVQALIVSRVLAYDVVTRRPIFLLQKVHNHQQSDGHRMRVSFAKNSTIHPTTV